ncbi:MAG TPA: 6-phosphogluconolactonase [Guyparkeria sp.]|nr:6-phosphogluconolactonase [Guyparkeria sp.]
MTVRSGNAEFHLSEQPEAASAACATHLVDRLAAAIQARGVARIALAGGNTPRRLYQILANQHHDALEWQQVEFYFGDERNVPPDHPDSNFRMARLALLKPLGIPAHQTFPMISDQQRDPEESAAAYEALLHRWSGDRIPEFDVTLLGLGDDGHFASLFPDTPALAERERLVVVNPVNKLQDQRLTMTFPVFEAAREVVFLVLGADKHAAVERIRAGRQELPAECLSAKRATHWFVDQGAFGPL